MTRKAKVKKRRTRTAKPRDPFWRARRALGARRVESQRAYSRSAARRAERDAVDDAD